jgi:hypothetical protein
MKSGTDGGWIGVDLDGVLARYDGWKGPEVIGDPIWHAVNKVKRLLEQGREVRIFTARACIPSQIPPVERWLESVGLPKLQVTCVKDIGCEQLWDDRALQYVSNTGLSVVEMLGGTEFDIEHAQSAVRRVMSALAETPDECRDVYTAEHIDKHINSKEDGHGATQA